MRGKFGHKTLLLLLVLAAFISVLIPTGIPALAHTDQENTCNVSRQSASNIAPYFLGNTFTTTPGNFHGSFQISAIEIGLSPEIATASSTVTLTLTAVDSNGLPTGSALGVATIPTLPYVNFGYTSSWQCGVASHYTQDTFVFATPLNLVANTTYAWYLSLNAAAFALDLQYGGNPSFAGGRMIQNTNTGWQFFGVNQQATFKIYSPYRASLVTATNSWFSLLQQHHFASDNAVIITYLFASIIVFWICNTLHSPPIGYAFGWIMVAAAFIFSGTVTPFSGFAIICITILGSFFTLKMRNTDRE